MKTIPVPIIVVQGAQYGSESKGMIAAHLCKTRGVDYAVRTGCINAGHTVYHNGKAYAMQQLPTGWVCPTTVMVLGPGAYIHTPTLQREVAMVATALGVEDKQIWDRILIDYRAGLHTDEDVAASKATDSHVSIGATGKGCSHAIVGRINNRKSGGKLFRDTVCHQHPMDGGSECAGSIVDTVELLNRAYDRGDKILLEGTQGHGLDLLLGPYPYTTHKPCQASQWIVEAGLSPSLQYEVVLVARTFPIRVAGNSGPMTGELSWPEFLVGLAEGNAGNNYNPLVPLVHFDAIARFERKLESNWGKVALSQHRLEGEDRVLHKEMLSKANSEALAALSIEDQRELTQIMELTTVTRKPRRIGLWDKDLINSSVMVNRPSWMALTFLNYLYPDTWGKGKHQMSTERMHQIAIGLGKLQHPDCPIRMVTTGPEMVWEGNITV